MKILPSLAKYGDTPIASFTYGYLAVCIGECVLVYKKNEQTFSVISSFDFPNTHIKSLGFISGAYSKQFILVVVSDNSISLCDILNLKSKSFNMKCSQVCFDNSSIDSFIVLENEKELTEYSYIDKDIFTIQKNWTLTFEDPLISVSISTYNSNYAIALTKASELIILNRKNQKFPYQIASSVYNITQDERVEGVTTISFGFAIAWSKHFIHLIHLVTGAAFTILSFTQDKMVSSVYANDDHDISFFVLYNDNSIEQFSIENSSISKPQSVNLPKTFNFAPLYVSKGDLIIISNYYKIYIIKKGANKTLSLNTFYTLPIMKEGTLVSKFNNQIVFSDVDDALTSYNYKTGVYSFRYPKQVDKLCYFSYNSIVYLIEGSVYLFEQKQQFDITELHIIDKPVTDLRTISDYIIVSDSNTIGVYCNGKVNTKTINDLQAYDVSLDNDKKLVIAISIKSKGIFFANEEMKPVFGSFPQFTATSYYSHISFDFPQVVGIDMSYKLYIFNLDNGECCKRVNYKMPAEIVCYRGESKFAFNFKNSIEIMNSNLELIEQIQNNSANILSASADTLTVLEKSGITLHQSSKSDNKYYELNFFQTKKPFVLSVESSREFIDMVIKSMSIPINYPEFVDDFNLILGEKPKQITPSITSDIKRVYHRFVLSFYQKEIPEENIEQLKLFIKSFEENKDFLGASLLSLIIGDKESTLKYLLMAEYFELAHIFAHLNNLDESIVIDSYLTYSLQSGNFINAIHILLALKRYHKIASILYEHEFNANLRYFNDKYDINSFNEESGCVNIEEILEFLRTHEFKETFVEL